TRRSPVVLLRRARSGRARPPARFARAHRNDGTSAAARAGLIRPDLPESGHHAQGGFGNLIALPLQKAAREQGNSVFLDDDLEPWADQWAFLASLHRLSRGQVESTVREAERRGRVLGVRLPPQEDDENEPWAAPPSRRHKAPAIAGD